MALYYVIQIVVDSISALARKEGMRETDRDQYLLKQVRLHHMEVSFRSVVVDFRVQASLLKQIAEICHCAVLVTNQVSAV